jgi:hypothetical protein
MENYKSKTDGFAVMKPILLGVILLSLVSTAYAQQEPTMKQLTTDGTMQIEIVWPPDIYPDTIRTFIVRFVDPSSGAFINKVTFDVQVTQGDDLIESYRDQLANGARGFEVLFEEPGSATVHVNVKRVGDTVMDEKFTFSVNVVPEFPVMLAIVMAASMAIVVLIRFGNIAKFSKMQS